jgi:hypothetical protein
LSSSAIDIKAQQGRLLLMNVVRGPHWDDDLEGVALDIAATDESPLRVLAGPHVLSAAQPSQELGWGQGDHAERP